MDGLFGRVQGQMHSSSYLFVGHMAYELRLAAPSGSGRLCFLLHGFMWQQLGLWCVFSDRHSCCYRQPGNHCVLRAWFPRCCFPLCLF